MMDAKSVACAGQKNQPASERGFDLPGALKSLARRVSLLQFAIGGLRHLEEGFVSDVDLEIVAGVAQEICSALCLIRLEVER